MTKVRPLTTLVGVGHHRISSERRHKREVPLSRAALRSAELARQNGDEKRQDSQDHHESEDVAEDREKGRLLGGVGVQP